MKFINHNREKLIPEAKNSGAEEVNESARRTTP